jgi:hypothetical protein
VAASVSLKTLSFMPTPSTASHRTDCKHQPLLFQDVGRRQVVADFSGGYLSSDGGVPLLRQLDRGLGLSRTLAQAFTDQRDPRYCDHTLLELLTQRLYGMALGYDDLNDHDTLRRDALLAVACEKREPLGADRLHAHPPGVALAGAATLNRLELGHQPTDRYHKIHYDPQALQATLLTMGVRCLSKHAAVVVVDLDGMGHLVHGLQAGRHFSAYYDGYCLLPLYAFVGDAPLRAALRPGDADAGADGVLPAMEAIVQAIRRRCKKARILFRADSAFAREDTMAWCERQLPLVYSCFGLARNCRLEELIQDALAAARARRCLTGAASAREFKELEYQTRESWSRSRRVVAKAEVSAAGDNPRFVVTNLPREGFRGEDRDAFRAAPLYERCYCGRGDMENVLKQQVLDLPGGRLSTHELASNQLRLWLATLAYLLLERLRTLGLRGTEWADATVGTIRLRLLKVAAAVTVSVRRVYVQLSSAFVGQALFRRCARHLEAAFT